MKRPRVEVTDPPLRAADFFLGASAAARMLGISVRRLYRLVSGRRILPDGFVEGEMRFRYSNLEGFVQSGLPGKYGRQHQSSSHGRFPLPLQSGRR